MTKLGTAAGGTPPAATTDPSKSAIRAKDIMTSSVATVPTDATVREIAALLAAKHISAVPVLDRQGSLVGIVSEADLIERPELGTAATGTPKSHGTRAADVMSAKVATVAEDAPLADIVGILQAERIKRVVVVRAAKLMGIVTRGDIVRALVRRPAGSLRPSSGDDDMIRYKAIDALMDIPGACPWSTTVTVSNGVVELDGTIGSEACRQPARRAIEKIPNVVEVRDRRAALQPY